MLCRLMNAGEGGCALCRKTHRELRRNAAATRQPQRGVCPNGMEVFTVPVGGDATACGVFEGGRVFAKRPEESVYQSVSCKLWPAAARKQPDLWRSSWQQISVVREEDLEAAIALVRCMAEEVSRSAESAGVEQMEVIPPQIERARAYAEEHLADKLSVGVAARVACLSEDYFSKLFKRSLGIGFTEYVARARVQWAQRLLLGSCKRISEVAYECGFESVPHFNRQFKRVAGVAPKAFRMAKWTPAVTLPLNLIFFFCDLGLDDLFCSLF